MMKLEQRFCLLAVIGALCSGSVACAPDSVSPSTVPHKAMRSVTAATLTGRIVYTLSGNLHIYNVARRIDVALGIAGINPKFSPDGTLIVYQNSGMRVMNSDGTNIRLLNVTGGVPSFDPSGSMIAYNDNGIWKINVDGTGKVQLNADGRQPAWSPSGAQIAFHAYTNGAEQLFIMNADGSNRYQALSSPGIIDIVWSPSSKILFGLLAARSNYDLYSYDPSVASSLTRLTANKGNDFEPSWSADATGISWTSGLGGIWLMNADGTGQEGPVASKGRQSSWGR